MEKVETDVGGRPIGFQYRRKRIEACEHETIASALYRSGVRIFGRSFKYHRPRGPSCLGGYCSNCLMRVNGVPNIRTCVTYAQEGDIVEPQSGWPSVEHDILGIIDRLDFLMPVGFYYKRLIRPRRLWPWYEQVIRRFAGHGRIPDCGPTSMQASEPRVSENDVLVVGGGPAGIMAALAAARTHALVILLDDQMKLGGHLIYQRRTYRNLPFGYSGEASTIVDMLWGELQKMENVEYKCNTTVFGIYEDNWVGAYESDGSSIQKAYLKIKPRNIVLAQGAYESFPLFENNDLPGIFPATGAQRLVNLHNVMLDDPVVVIARSDFGHIVASEVVDSGSKVVTLLDKRKQAVDSRNQRTFEDAGVVKWNCVPVRATGRSLFNGLVTRDESDDRLLRCSGRSLVVEGSLRPRTELTALAGVHAMDWSNPDAPSVSVDEKMCSRVGVYVAGDAAGINSLAESLIEGYIAGYFAAVSAGKSSAELANEVKKWRVEMNRFQDSKRDEYGW